MFHHTKIVQPKAPKPHLRLHVRAHAQSVCLDWSVERGHRNIHGYFPHSSGERTTWWATSRLALDAAYFQFTCEWPAGRPGR